MVIIRCSYVINDKSIFSTTITPELTVRQRSYCNRIPLQTNSASFTVVSLQNFFFVRFCCHFGLRAVPEDTTAKTSVCLGIHLKQFSHIMRCACALDRGAPWQCAHCVGRTLGVSEDGVRHSISRSGSNSRKAQAMKLMNACALVISINSSRKGPFYPVGSGLKLGLYALCVMTHTHRRTSLSYCCKRPRSVLFLSRRHRRGAS